MPQKQNQTKGAVTMHSAFCLVLAEREGFEPSRGIHP